MTIIGPVHIIPVDDLQPHERKTGCWCGPIVEEDGDLIIHNAADGREPMA